MTTLDDKLLGIKSQYYCDSGSESENESSDEKLPTHKATVEDEPSPSVDTEWNGLSKNTGLKGVLEDWQQYQELARKQREVSEKERLELCKKLSSVCRPESEDNDDSDSFLLEYRKKRMQEMMSQFSKYSVKCTERTEKSDERVTFLMSTDLNGLQADAQ
ncbi:hypothetical protein U1Q18_042361 [Sarracenia purpurea var. burkii]